MNTVKNKIAKLFENLCCSQCKSDFDEESIEILREEDSILVVRLNCCKCGKSFGVAFMGINNVEINSQTEPLKMIDELPPITTDDVLNASKFIKNLDEHWTQYLP